MKWPRQAIVRSGFNRMAVGMPLTTKARSASEMPSPRGDQKPPNPGQRTRRVGQITTKPHRQFQEKRNLALRSSQIARQEDFWQRRLA